MSGAGLRLLPAASDRGFGAWTLCLVDPGVDRGVILPTMGMVALAAALVASGLPGEIGLLITAALPVGGFIVFSPHGWARWPFR